MQISHEVEDLFFDSHDCIRTSIDSLRSEDSSAENSEEELRKFGFDFWTSEPTSVQERRERFLRVMGFHDFKIAGVNCLGDSSDGVCNRLTDAMNLERIKETSGAVLGSSPSVDHEEHRDSFCCIRDLDSGKKFIAHELGQDGLLSMLKEVGSDRLMTMEEFESSLGLSGSVQRFMQREAASLREKNVDCPDSGKKKSRRWWRNFLVKRHTIGNCMRDVSLKNDKLPRTMRTKVKQHRKKCVEFTALYMGQEFQAHKGWIRTMKFNPSGWYLGSGGEDCVVRIWQVREVEASCKSFSVKRSYKLVDKIKDGKLLLGRKCHDSASVIVPRKVFKIEEAPLQEFYGHTSDVLDLSWSKTDCLLTSSKDKTVRMWKVGCDGCLQVFQHNNFVTCIQFNPVDERYFISGSIDGKVRIWGVSENRVVDWVDVRDIVSSVCYKPDGKGFLVGSITGNCRLYDCSGTSLQLDSQLCSHARNKSKGKCITSLQYSPEDPEKALVSSADSKVRIYDGSNVVHKFRGLRKSKSQLSASFTSDGRYIVSVDDDSNVYIWNRVESEMKSCKGATSVRSCEFFYSKGASIAVPWPGIDRNGAGLSRYNDDNISTRVQKILEQSTWLRDPDCFSLGLWFMADGSRGSATWPEEKLPPPSEPSPVSPHHHRERQRHLQNYFHCLTSLSATWSLVILTASQDGFIRSFHNYGLPIRL